MAIDPSRMGAEVVLPTRAPALILRRARTIRTWDTTGRVQGVMDYLARLPTRLVRRRRIHIRASPRLILKKEATYAGRVWIFVCSTLALRRTNREPRPNGSRSVPTRGGVERLRATIGRSKAGEHSENV